MTCPYLDYVRIVTKQDCFKPIPNEIQIGDLEHSEEKMNTAVTQLEAISCHGLSMIHAITNWYCMLSRHHPG